MPGHLCWFPSCQYYQPSRRSAIYYYSVMGHGKCIALYYGIFLRVPNTISSVVFDPIIASIDQIVFLHNVVSYQAKLVVERFARQLDFDSRVTTSAALYQFRK